MRSETAREGAAGYRRKQNEVQVCYDQNVSLVQLINNYRIWKDGVKKNREISTLDAKLGSCNKSNFENT